MATLTLKKTKRVIEPRDISSLFSVVRRRPEGHTMRFTKFHQTIESAIAEATRLSEQEGFEFLVLHPVHQVTGAINE